MSAVFLLLLLLLLPLSVHAEDLGELSANPFNPDSTSNPFGAGSPFKSDGINNPFSPYGSPYSNQSATNPFATDAPRLLVRLSGLSGLFSLSGYLVSLVIISQPNERDKPNKPDKPVLVSANKTDQIDLIHDIDQFRLSLLAGFDQESLRSRESLQPQQSHESLRQGPPD